jgi:hypothetical protein
MISKLLCDDLRIFNGRIWLYILKWYDCNISKVNPAEKRKGIFQLHRYAIKAGLP